MSDVHQRDHNAPMTELRDPRAATSTPSTPRGGPLLNRAIVAVGVGAACFATAHTAMFATLPVYVAERGGTESDIALIVGSIGLVSVLTRPLTGWLIDAWGRRAMLLSGIGAM
ncbi:MAG: hypothetical protein NZ518_12280, partial [Dehalococcoidia bacterium]|nr:hypothetical protein [Dehalococcoidia bacterium]